MIKAIAALVVPVRTTLRAEPFAVFLAERSHGQREQQVLFHNACQGDVVFIVGPEFEVLCV